MKVGYWPMNEVPPFSKMVDPMVESEWIVQTRELLSSISTSATET